MGKERMRCIASLMVSVLATAVASGMLAVMMNYIIGEYSLQSAQEGLMNSMVSTGAVCSLLGLIFLGKRVQKKHWIAGGGLIMALMLLVQGIPQPFTLFLAVCFVLGAGLGVADACQSAYLTDLAPKGSAGYMGVLHGIFGLGGLLTPIVLNLLLHRFHWRSVYLLSGVLCLLLILQFAIVSRGSQKREPKAPTQKPAAGHQSLKRFLKSRYFLLLLITLFFGAAGQSGIIVWTFRYVYSQLGNLTAATACLSLFWVFSTLSRFVFSLLPFSRSTTLGGGAAIAAVAWAGAVLVNSPLAFCIACCVTGLASGMCMPLLLHEGTTLFRDDTGTAAGIMMVVKTAAQAAAPLLVSFAMALLGMRMAMLATVAFFTLNALLAILAGGLKPTAAGT